MRYDLRIIQEYFQPKIGRKIRIFSLGRKNNILIKKRVYLYLISCSIDKLNKVTCKVSGKLKWKINRKKNC